MQFYFFRTTKTVVRTSRAFYGGNYAIMCPGKMIYIKLCAYTGAKIGITGLQKKHTGGVRMKKVVAIIVAVVIAAGVGTGAWYVLKTRNTESTSEEKPESVRTVIDQEEYATNAPYQTVPDVELHEGWYYVPINTYNAGYGPLIIEWVVDGYTVKVENFRHNDGYAVFTLNEYGEVTEKIYYETDVDAFGNPKFYKNVVTPRDRYNEKHWLLEWDDGDASFLFEHDDKGNVTERYRISDTKTSEYFSYDKYGNIDKFVVKNIYSSFIGYAGTKDMVVDFENKLDSLGNIVERQKTINGTFKGDTVATYKYSEVSEAQYMFYNNFLKTWIVSKENRAG